MRVKSQITTFFIFFNCLVLDLKGQQLPIWQEYVPASPQASMIQRFGQSPVSEYTGVPGIDIPIYDIRLRGFSLSVKLSYHAGGNRIEDIASSVGLGWSLQAGGAITREIRGLPDDGLYGYMTTHERTTDFVDGNLNSTEFTNYLLDVERGLVDAEPDLYYFNFGSLSGKFFIDTDGYVQVIPRSKIKIEYIQDEGKIISWKATDAHGNDYLFDVSEVTRQYNICDGGETNPYPDPYITNTWYLTEVKTVEGDLVTLEYDGYQTSYLSNFSETKYEYLAASGHPCSEMTFVNCHSENTIYGLRLSRISFDQGYILFVKSMNERCDLEGDYPLQYIEIRNSYTELIDKFQLFHSYATPYGIDLSCSEFTPGHRLMLDSVHHGISQKNKYLLKYNELKLPDQTSKSMDHWGYFNYTSNGSLIPTVKHPFASGVFFYGANRDANELSTKALILEEITYPTGGTTVFEYENNRVKDISVTNVFQQTERVEYHAGDGLTHYFEKEILIEDARESSVLMSVNLSGLNINPPFSMSNESGIFYIKNVSTLQEFHFRESINNLIIPTGTYMFIANLDAGINISFPELKDFGLVIRWRETPQEALDNMIVGGLRIKSIYDKVGSEIVGYRKYKYTTDVENQVSSGALVRPAIFNSNIYSKQITVNCWNGIELDPIGGTSTYLALTTVPNISLGLTRGSPVGYGKVTVEFGESGQFGKIESEFINPSNVADESHPFPYAQGQSFDWKRGIQTSRKEYAYTESGYELRRQVVSSYENLTENYTGEYVARINGVKTGRSVMNQGMDLTYPDYNIYEIQTDWFHPLEEITTVYEYQPEMTELHYTTIFEYSDVNFMPSGIIRAGSDGKEYYEKFKYAHDLSESNLINNHMYDQILEKLTYKEESLIDKMVVDYISDPLSETIQVAKVRKALYPIVPESEVYVDEFEYKNFDNKGRVRDVIFKNGNKKSYKWGYKNSLVIAECLNCESDDFAFSNFECADCLGDWTMSLNAVSDAYAGIKSHELNGHSISKSGLIPEKMYTVTYWAKGGQPSLTGVVADLTGNGVVINGWSLYKKLVSGVTSISISGTSGVLIDELRLAPRDSKMETFTYKLGVGVTSMADVNCLTTFYEYDSFNRLQFIKDDQGNVVKRVDYRYANQE